MNFLKKRRNRVILFIVCGMVILFVLPSVVIKIYINSDSFRNRISEEINKRVKFENLLLSYSIGEIGIFSGVEFIKIQLSDKNGKVAELNNCHIRGIERKILLQQNSFSVYCRKGIADIEFFEREGRQGSKISQEGRKSNYNIFVKIESFEVFYRKMRAEFELSGKYSNSEKYIEIELKDKYRIRITDIDFGKKSAKISFSDIDIPFLLERYMGRYAGLVNGKLGGSVIARKKGQEIEVEFSDVMVRNMSLTHPLVGEKPFAIKKFLLNGRFSVSVASGLLRLNELEADISEMNFLVSGRFYKGQYSFDFLTKRLMLNDLALFFGGEEFEGFDMKGEIKIKASVIGNISQVKKIEKISIYGDVINPVQVSARLNYLKNEFDYEFTGRNGKKRKVLIGPANPDFVHYQDIPKIVYGAVVVSEDAGFFGHKGVEFKEIESAVMDNIENDRPYMRGGSTITQQLVKNLFLTREKTLLRKMKELLLAIELDAALSKERILEIYLNGIEWGPDIFGIGAASRHYFGKNPSELKAIEAAYLASVIPNPNRYYTYYFKNEIPDKWYEKIQSILYRMNLFQYLSDDEYNQSLNEKIIFERTALAK